MEDAARTGLPPSAPLFLSLKEEERCGFRRGAGGGREAWLEDSRVAVLCLCPAGTETERCMPGPSPSGAGLLVMLGTDLRGRVLRRGNSTTAIGWAGLQWWGHVAMIVALCHPHYTLYMYLLGCSEGTREGEGRG